jgi:PAS domain-containing protein
VARPQPETELEEFFDLSIDPLSIIGFDGEFKRVNASFVRLLGYPKSELLSRSSWQTGCCRSRFATTDWVVPTAMVTGWWGCATG